MEIKWDRGRGKNHIEWTGETVVLKLVSSPTHRHEIILRKYKYSKSSLINYVDRFMETDKAKRRRNQKFPSLIDRNKSQINTQTLPEFLYFPKTKKDRGKIQSVYLVGK